MTKRTAWIGIALAIAGFVLMIVGFVGHSPAVAGAGIVLIVALRIGVAYRRRSS